MKFEVWFKAQFGTLPLTQEERERLTSTATEGRVADVRLRDDDVIVDKYHAALTAWRCDDIYKAGTTP